MTQSTKNETDKNLTPKERESFDFTGLILDYLSHWKWFLLSVVLCCAIGYFYGAMKIPVYRIESMLYLTTDQNASMQALSMSSPLFSLNQSNDETELEIMKSRNSMIRIVDSLDLAYTYYEKGTLRDKALYRNSPVLVSMPIDSLHTLRGAFDLAIKPLADGKVTIKASYHSKEKHQDEEFEKVTLPFTVNLADHELLVERSPRMEPFDKEIFVSIESSRATATTILKALSLSYIKKSEKIVRVELNDQVERRAQDIINAMVYVYNQDIIANQNQTAIQTEQFLLERLISINDELKDVEHRLENYRENHGITNAGLQSTLNIQLSNEYEKSLTSIEAQLSILDALIGKIAGLEPTELLPTSGGDASALNKVISAYNLKVTRLNRMLEASSESNPLIISLREEINREKANVLDNIRTSRENLYKEKARVVELNKKNTSQLAGAPAIDTDLQEIFREQQVKANIYTFLLKRREEIALQKMLAVNTVRLIDNPAEDRKISPHRFLIMVLALMLGLAIPGVIIYLRRRLFAKFADQSELEKITKVPVLGEICSTKTGKNDVLVVGKNLTTAEAELFRLLRNNLSFTRNAQTNKVILVTSSVSGEGKTFITANLAMTYALMGKRVCVVGMDLRRPMLAGDLGVSNRSGLTTYLSGHTDDYMSLLQQSPANENLFIMAAGPVPPNPNELLMSDRMDSLMQGLRRNFDYIFIDSAPIGLVSDTLLILRQSDIQIFVTRANYTTRKGIKTLHDAVALDKFKNVYIVINGVDITSSAYNYRRYGHYGYGSRKAYGYGYASKR